MPKFRKVDYDELFNLGLDSERFPTEFKDPNDPNKPAENHKQWFKDECNKIKDKFGYAIHDRASGSDAFRLYLIAEKNYAHISSLLISISLSIKQMT